MNKENKKCEHVWAPWFLSEGEDERVIIFWCTHCDEYRWDKLIDISSIQVIDKT